MALSLTMTGSGSLGGVLPGWTVLEQATPAIPGDSRGSVGSASFRAWAKPTSRFVADNDCLLDSPGGVWRGRVSEVSVDARADVSLAGAAQFLTVDKTVPPVWFDRTVDLSFATYGSGTGQVGRVAGVAVDPVDHGIVVSSYDIVDGVDRFKIIKFDQHGNFVTEFGSNGAGSGQIGLFGATVAVSPVDQAIWIGDLFNLRLQKFVTVDGGLTYSWSLSAGSSGSGDGQFGSSSSYIPVAVDSTGRVFAGDRGNARLQRFTSAGAYSAKVAIGSAGDTIYALTITSADVVRVGFRASAASATARIDTYNTSLALQSTVTVPRLSASSTGISSMAADVDGGTQVVDASSVVKFDSNWVRQSVWYTNSPAFVAAGASGVFVYVQPSISDSLRRVIGFRYEPVTLSQTILRYMEASDSTLNGWTLDYQATINPNVVFPGWSGNVWANLKELFATYAVELVQDAATQTFIVRDIGSTTATIVNHSPIVTRPVNLTGGRVVDVVYQQPRAGGGVVWDAATENVPLSIGVGQRQTKVLYTVNHPAELAQPVPTDTLPIQPGQYYPIDSTGVHVPAATWLVSGANITLKVGDSPGTIEASTIGPSAAISGFTGPFQFATGTTAADTPALSIVGNGTFCNPVTFARAESQGQPFNSPFMDTLDRVLSRGHYPSQKAPNVVITFTCPSRDLPAMGKAVGSIITVDGSKYRILEVRWGNLTAGVTAERYVTVADQVARWSGQTLATKVAFWSGYSVADKAIQPLRT